MQKFITLEERFGHTMKRKLSLGGLLAMGNPYSQCLKNYVVSPDSSIAIFRFCSQIMKHGYCRLEPKLEIHS